MRWAVLAALSALGSCASAGDGARQPPPAPAAVHSNLYQPLAVGDRWKYTCRDVKGGGENGGNPFTIEDRVVGTARIGTREAFEFAREIPIVPSAPLEIEKTTMLLANDPKGNLQLYGYVVAGKVRAVKPATIVSSVTPQKYQRFDYTGSNGKRVQRLFCCIEPTNPTPLGVFTVADYEESDATNDYGYARGVGVAEEDHGPNYEVDCRIEAYKSS